MVKFLFLFDYLNAKDNFFLYNLLPIKDNDVKKNKDEHDNISQTVKTYYENEYYLYKANHDISFNYNNHEVDLRVGERLRTKEQIDNFVRKQNKKYDAVFVFSNTLTEPISDKYNHIYIECDEIIQSKRLVDIIIKSNDKILTSSKKEGFEFENNYFNYRLSFYYFYYLLGFYHLNLEKIKVDKQNLLGTYLKKYYRNDRDILYDKILEKFEDKTKFKNYSFEFQKDLALSLDLKYNLGWMKNHITSYTDYIRSLFILNFETDSPDVTDTYHMTEKTIKSILFSKLNIPSILFAHQSLLLKLKEDGFWFLNFDFINFEKLSNWKQHENDEYIEIILESITKSVDFILGLNKKFDGNYKEIENYIVENYSDKLENNYKLFKNILNDIDIKEEVFNTITKNYKTWHNQNTHLI